jgi:hypothetical protein
MVDERARETIFMWYSLFNLPHRESVAAVHDRVVTPDYVSCTGDGPGECWDKQKSIQVIPKSGKRFRVMTLDVHTLEGGKIRKTYHMENWFAAMLQLRS